jgi:uncharacterized protein (TIGR00255 family)
MTGYASASANAGSDGLSNSAASATITVDVRSVNGRFLDLSLRLPDELRHLEPALREAASAQLKRGKVELRLALQRPTDDARSGPALEQLVALQALQLQVQQQLPQARPLSVNEALGWCRNAAGSSASDDTVMATAAQALSGLVQARAREGQRLVVVLRERVAALLALAAQAEPLLPQVVARQRERFVERWNEALAAGSGTASAPSTAAAQERALTEATAFAIRIDVAEELARLRSHLAEIERLLTRGGELGKRLDFLIQELQREANTLGSKSAALELTQISVEMKVAIEQMREQVQNIE